MHKIELFTNISENKEEIINAIQKQQIDCIEYVLQLTKEQITELVEQNNYFFVRNSLGEIVASGYRLPLLDSVNEDDQIYRLGGLSIKDFTNSNIETVKNTIALFKEARDYFEDNNVQLIMATENFVIGKFLKSKGRGEELSYDECYKKYPHFLYAYMQKLKEPNKDDYKKQTFYIKTKK